MALFCCFCSTSSLENMVHKTKSPASTLQLHRLVVLCVCVCTMCFYSAVFVTHMQTPPRGSCPAPACQLMRFHSYGSLYLPFTPEWQPLFLMHRMYSIRCRLSACFFFKGQTYCVRPSTVPLSATFIDGAAFQGALPFSRSLGEFETEKRNPACTTCQTVLVTELYSTRLASFLIFLSGSLTHLINPGLPSKKDLGPVLLKHFCMPRRVVRRNRNFTALRCVRIRKDRSQVINIISTPLGITRVEKIMFYLTCRRDQN